MHNSSAYYFHMKSNILSDFRICISALVQERILFLFLSLGSRNLWYQDFQGSWEKLYHEKRKMHIFQIMVSSFEPLTGNQEIIC